MEERLRRFEQGSEEDPEGAVVRVQIGGDGELHTHLSADVMGTDGDGTVPASWSDRPGFGYRG